MDDVTEHDDAPFTERSLARLALAATARELADSLTEMVAVYETEFQPIEDAARFVRRANELLIRAVICERVDRIPWEEIGEELGITRQSAHTKFAAAVKEWEEAFAQPVVVEEERLVSGAVKGYAWNRMPAGTDDPERTAAELDAWALRRRDPDFPGDSRPVSGGMRRMGPHLELMKLSDRRAALLKEFLGPPAFLMAEISEREAVLWERLDGQHPDSTIVNYAAQAERARQTAAVLREQDALLRKAAETMSAAEHQEKHEQRWSKDIWGPYRLFREEASGRDWCAHCNLWIAEPGTES